MRRHAATTTRRCFAIGLVLLGGALAAPRPAAAAVPDLALHYEFAADDLATGQIADVSGHGLNGALVNGSTATVVSGAGDGVALHLPGGGSDSNGAYVRLPKAVLDGRSDLTVAARVKWDGTAAPWQRIFDLGKNTSRYLFTTPSNGDGNLRTAITTSGGGGEAQVTGYAALPANAWKTVTVVLDTGADRVTTYLDGAAVGSAPTTLTAGDLVDAATTSGGYLGKSLYPDPLFAGAIDDFQVYGAALSAQQVAEAAGVDPPTPTRLAQTSFDVRTTIGTPPPLPPATRAAFSDAYDRDVAIRWEPVDPALYAQRGSFTVSGTAAGTAVTAKVTVIREGEVSIDLATDTGAFRGGASGTLYGLYGPGVPTNNLIEGMHLRTVSTKAQDGPQHPGADALEVVKPLVDSTGGDVYIYMTDIHRGFPYEWPGSTSAEKLALYEQKIAVQVDQALQLDRKYQRHIVFVPFNEPEGNMFGTGQWSYDGVSWLQDPTDYFRAWDEVYRLIKGKLPAARIAGPNTSILYGQDKGWLEHTVAAGTVPDTFTWHELSHPEHVRTSVAQYRALEREVFAGTAYEGRTLPININEYAFNYHTSVPGQMIQWVSAFEESKVDADVAYWNIDGNLSDSAVQANRGNGQWWLFNAYGSMTGHTVELRPPAPGQNYSLQGVASLDERKAQARAIIGGASGKSYVTFDHVPARVFGTRVHATIREIPWTGQIGDSPQPGTVAEYDADVAGGSVAFDFGGALPALAESSAYEIVLSPATRGGATTAPRTLWERSYEAEAATYTGSGYSKNGPEGSPADVSKFYTSGNYDVGGLRTGSDGKLDFAVDVPKSGKYDLSVFANSLNTYDLVKEQGPTNVFLRVDGGAEQELFLPLGYKWVVWDHADTTVGLTAGKHVITLAARSLDGSKATKGDAILDRIVLALPNPAAATSVYEAELADLQDARPVYGRGLSGDGAASIRAGGVATFWVYSAKDAEATLDVDLPEGGTVRLAVNGHEVLRAGRHESAAAVSLSGGINKVALTGVSRSTLVDRVTVTPTARALVAKDYEAEDATLRGTAHAAALPLASGGTAVEGVGGDPGNANDLTFTVRVNRSGTYAMRVRYSNPEQSPATHYNPDPLARHADISVNGRAAQRVLFPHSFHRDNFWELTVPLQLRHGTNTIRFSSAELPNFDGTTYASDSYPDVPLRSMYAPVIDKIAIAPFSVPLPKRR
jgi:Concanavalin A-like lectin/glucanases superfamily/Bacterial Ig-like domain (group 4)